ncbi:MAG: DUF4306 domain-containing protein [Lysinibacillus sp.]
MYKYVVHIMAGCAVFLASAFVAFYEGSALAENSWEWSYSAPVTSMMGTEVQEASDISRLDYFYYAAKHEPLFPLAMIASVLYISIICGLLLLRLGKRHAVVYFGLVAAFSVGGAGALMGATSSGGKWFVSLFAMTAVVAGGYAIIAWRSLQKQADI